MSLKDWNELIGSLQDVLATHARPCGGGYIWGNTLFSLDGSGWALVYEEKKYRRGDSGVWKWIIRSDLPYHDQEPGGEDE